MTEILLPNEIIERIRQKIGDQSLSQYLCTLVEKDLQNPVYKEEEEQKIKERLRSLGYID